VTATILPVPPEIRDDPRGLWVVVAPDRRDRANAFSTLAEPIGPERCPFCPGREEQTPPEIERSGGNHWQTRVVPNKYPAVEPGHEVLIETPEHSILFDQLSEDRAADILQLHRRRYEHHREREQVIVFKNEGRLGGASIPHPHSQLIALNRLTPRLTRELAASRDPCWTCAAFTNETLVARGESFAVIAPPASFAPYQLVIAPLRHVPNFLQSEAELNELARLVQSATRAFREGAGAADYNWVYMNANDRQKSFHWYLEITPRLTVWGGFELASQTAINVVEPETAARELTPWFEEHR
jgi:UDPglucose--hexose-1-phosphate uridylyltransferase